MPSTNFGSSALWHHSNLRVDQHIRPTGGNAFLLGLNAPYGGFPHNPKFGEMMTAPPGNERVDDWNHGVIWEPLTMPGMALCFGSARSGKGAGLIVPALLTYGGNTFTNDPKGEDYQLTGQHRRTPISDGGIGHKVVLCDPFGEVKRQYRNPDPVTKYNPLAELNPASPDFPEDVAAVGEAISIDLGGGENSNFFSGSGRDMIDGLIAAVVEGSELGRGTLRHVRSWLNLDDASFGEQVRSYCEMFPNSLGAMKLRAYTDMTNRTNINVKSTAKQQTVFLDSEQLLQYMEPAPGEPTFSFAELSRGALDVYLVLPGTHTVSYKRWTRLMANQAMRAVLRNGVPQLGLPVAFILDEAGTTLGHLEAVETAYGLTSGKGILVWSFYQDLSQLKRDYRDTWPTFISNSAAIQLVRVGDLETAEYFSKHMGQTTVTTRNPGSSSSQSAGPGGGSSSSGSSVSFGETGRAVLMPDELMKLPNGDAKTPGELIVLMAGMHPFQQFKVSYFKDARYSGLYNFDPQRQNSYPAALAMPEHLGVPAWNKQRELGLRVKQSLGGAVLLTLICFVWPSFFMGLMVVAAFITAGVFKHKADKMELPYFRIEIDPKTGIGNAVPR